MNKLQAVETDVFNYLLGVVPNDQINTTVEGISTILREHLPAALIKSDVQEPVFVLRGQDTTAGRAIGYWLSLNPELPRAKAEAAAGILERMGLWNPQRQAD
jgi:hypothetical protein